MFFFGGEILKNGEGAIFLSVKQNLRSKKINLKKQMASKKCKKNVKNLNLNVFRKLKISMKGDQLDLQ
jgi:hypothetical protein